MKLQTIRPLRSPSLQGIGRVKRNKKTSPFLSHGSSEHKAWKRKQLPKTAQRQIEKAENETREREAAIARRNERNEGDITYKVQRAAKPNAEGLSYYWQERKGGKFGGRFFVSEAVAKAVASEADKAKLWPED